MNNPPHDQPNWESLLAWAQAEVESVLRSLPGTVRVEARQLPVTCEHCPNAALIADGIEADTLGLFVGAAYGEAAAPSPIPSQIILFLDNLWDQSEADEGDFRREVRTTFLHELGHYLGWDEDDLMERGLD